MAGRKKKSKKRSAASSTSTQPDPIFFIDHCLGRDQVPNALRSAGAQVRIHVDLFPVDMRDEELLAAVGAEGWVFLSKDANIRRRELERRALLEAGLRAFFLTAADMRGPDQANLFARALPRNAEEELLLHAGVNGAADDWSSDGKWLLYQLTGQKTGVDLWLLPLEGERKPIPYLQTPFNETNARFSPGPGTAPRWMAYQSDESGQNQIYVQAIPASGAKYQISTSGGTQPAWRRDGKELFYFSTDQKLMAVPISLGTTVEPGTPQELFANSGMTGYAPSPDGQRFLVNVPAGGEGATAPPITVVLNWTAALKK